MLAYLQQRAGANTDATNWIAKDVLDLAGRHYLRPQSRAALFHAAAKVPRVRPSQLMSSWCSTSRPTPISEASSQRFCNSPLSIM